MVIKLEFIDFVVSDSPTAYPDGGEQGGYWYEKVVEGMPLEILGCTKFAIDKFTLTSNTNVYNAINIRHSLGEKPFIWFLFAKNPSSTNNHVHYAHGISKQGHNDCSLYTGHTFLISKGTLYNNGASGSSEDSYITYSGLNATILTAGVEYTLITMA